MNISRTTLGKLERKIKKALFPPSVTWEGHFTTWAQATEQSVGYSAHNILETCVEASIKARDGQCAFARDGMAFDTLEINYPLLASLQTIRIQLNRKIRVCDFGGSLGDTYTQHRSVLSDIVDSWTVVEQDHYVKIGRKEFQSEPLRFETDFPSALSGSIDLILFSSVLQYLEDPWSTLSQLTDFKIPYVIIDRTPMHKQSSDRLTVQTVKPPLYKASYPCWFFEKKRLMDCFPEYIESLSWVDNSYRFENMYHTGMLMQLRVGVDRMDESRTAVHS